MAYTLRSGSEGKFLEEKYVTWDEVGLIGPVQTPSSLWAWGRNGYGQLGQGDITHRSSPVQVGSLTNWKQIALGGYGSCLAIKTDGTLWAWGHGGISVTGGHQSSPVQVGSLTNWKQVAIGYYGQSLSVKTNGTLWAWGYNGSGELGLNDVTHRYSPVQVGSLTNWKQVACGQTHSLAIKTDGTLWAWGGNGTGQLGLGNQTNRLIPTQVGSLTNWKQVACGQTHSLAIKTDGTLWSWGNDNNRQLGLGNYITASSSSPIQVGTLANWKSVSSTALVDYSLAIKTDGTLWSWCGTNYGGELGLGDRVGVSRPVQVGTLTDWKFAYCGPSLAIKTDGSLWAWGGNTYGELGLGDRVPRSSPVQVGSLTNWKFAAGSGTSSLASKYNF